MDDITIPVDKVVKNGLNITEYLSLYNIASGYTISKLVSDPIKSLISLEENVFFTVDEDLFTEWLNTYPTMVMRKHGGKRALSPAGASTILGKKLRAKWDRIFKKDTGKQRQAIDVLALQVKDMKRSGDLEYMVEAARWLNEGYHEKYSYLLESNTNNNKYENEDYM